jgi:tetratricopeptide (TPR) repeat protein
MKKIGKTRKKLAQRNILLGSLSPEEREALEKASRTLDSVLGRVWRQLRLSRRLRVILEYEAPWRSQLAQIQGQALLSQIERDAFSKNVTNSAKILQSTNHRRGILDIGLSPIQPMKDERFFLHIFSAEILNIVVEDSQAQPPPTQTKTTLNTLADPAKTIPEALQSLVQSITIARRVGQWQRVISGCQRLLAGCNQLIQSQLLQTDFWKGALWRAFLVAGEALMDMLETVSITQENPTLDPLLVRKSPVGYVNTNPTPLMSIMELHTNNHMASWTDQYNDSQSEIINLSWCGKFLLLGVETMLVSEKPHRLLQFSDRFNKLFNGTYTYQLQPLVAKAMLLIENKAASSGLASGALQNIAQGHSVITSLKTQAELRPIDLFTLSHEHHKQVIDEQEKGMAPFKPPLLQTFIKAFELYEQTISAASSSNDVDVLIFALHDYADLLYAHGDIKGAAVYWSRCLDTIFGVTKFISSWKSVLSSESVADLAGNLRNLVIAGFAAGKMAELAYNNEHDKNEELVLLSSKLLSAVLHASINIPTDHLSLLFVTPNQLVPALNIFGPFMKCEPKNLSFLLYSLAGKLIGYDRLHEAIPVVALLSYVSANVTQDDGVHGLSQLLKCEIFAKLGYVRHSLDKLVCVASGKALLSKTKTVYGSTASLMQGSFNEANALFESSNLTYILEVSNLQCPEKLLVICGKDFGRKYDLFKCSILTRILRLANANDPLAANITVTKTLCNALDNFSVRHNPIGASVYIKSLSTAIEKLDEKRILSTAVIDEYPVNSLKIYGAPMIRALSQPSPSSQQGPPESQDKEKLSFSEWSTVYLVLDRLSATLTRIFAEVRGSIRGLSSQSKFLRHELSALADAGDCISEIYSLRLQFDCAAKWLVGLTSNHRYSSLTHLNFSLIYVQDILSKTATDPKYTDSNCWLRIRLKAAKALHSQGLIKHAKVIAEAGIKDSKEAQSKAYEVLFHGIRLQCTILLQDGKNACDNELSAYQQLLNDNRKTVNALNLSESWEVLGDVLAHVRSDNVEAICLSYDMADEYLQKYIERNPNKKIPTPAYSPFIARLVMYKFKRAQAYNALGNNIAAHELLIDALHKAAITPHCVNRSLIMPLAVSLAEILFKEAFYSSPESPSLGDENDNLKRAFASVIVSEISARGTHYRLLHSALRGLLAIAIEERDIDAIRDITFASGQASTARAALLQKKYDNVFSKDCLQTQHSSLDLPPVIERQKFIKELLDCYPSPGDEVLRPPKDIDSLVNFERSEVTLTAMELMEFASSLRRFRACPYSFPSDPFQSHIGLRIRTYYEGIAKILGDGINTVTLNTMPAKVIDLIADVEQHVQPGAANFLLRRPPSNSPSTSQQYCVQWINKQLSHVNYCGSPDCVPAQSWVLIICFLVPETSGKRKSKQSKQGSSTNIERDSKPSSAKLSGSKSKPGSTATLAGSPKSLEDITNKVLKVHTAQMICGDIEAIRANSRAALINLKKYEVTSDKNFLDTAQKAYEETLHLIKRALGGETLSLVVKYHNHGAGLFL